MQSLMMKMGDYVTLTHSASKQLGRQPWPKNILASASFAIVCRHNAAVRTRTYNVIIIQASIKLSSQLHPTQGVSSCRHTLAVEV